MPKKILIFLTLAVMIAGGSAWAQGDDLPDAIINPGPVPGHILVVDKSEQLIYLYKHDGQGAVSLEKIMSCSTGKRQGDKMVEGDKKTPEGFYVFVEKKLPREMSPIFGILAYPTDYPNFWDKHLGRGGYGIWMHGIDKPLKDYDSNGCVELENYDIAPMEDLIQLYDTPIIIYEIINKAPVEQLDEEGRKVVAFVESWGRAWIGKDYEAYQAHYDPDFVNSDGQSFAEWMNHKKEVGRQTDDIKLGAKDLRIFRHRDVLVAIFQQDYQAGEGFASSGLKRLYLKQENGGYKIVAEEYQPLPDKTTTKWLTAGQKRKVMAEAKTETRTGENLPSSPTELQTVSEGQLDFISPEDMAEAGSKEITPGGDDVASIRGQVNINSAADDGKKNLAPSESGALSRAEEEALSREEARLNQEMARERVEASEAQTRKALQKDRARSTGRDSAGNQVNVALDPETRALAAARDKMAGKVMTKEELKDYLISLALSWGEAWNKRDTEAYFAFYDPEFFYQEKSLDLIGFIAYRKELIEKAGILEVDLSHFSVSFQGDQARVMFRQAYRSDNVRDLGRKILTFKDSGTGWKIVSETWQSF